MQLGRGLVQAYWALSCGEGSVEADLTAKVVAVSGGFKKYIRDRRKSGVVLPRHAGAGEKVTGQGVSPSERVHVGCGRCGEKCLGNEPGDEDESTF